MEEINWCYLFGITPVCVLFPTGDMAVRFRRIFEVQHEISLRNNIEINLITEGDILHNIGVIITINPKRIYIDELQLFNNKTVDILKAKWDNSIIAYGTGIDGSYNPSVYNWALGVI